MGLDFDQLDGQTPLDEDEKEGLLIPTIAARNELDEFEQQNIEQTFLWLKGRRLKTDTILTEKFIRTLHKRMYGKVWKWAGEFRKTDKNIGVEKWKIPIELRSLLDDAKFWIDHHIYGPDEIAIRFKYRLVTIHCFPNGNGRHSRLMADIIIEKIFGLQVFTWGARNLTKQGDSRHDYLAAIKAADHGDIKPLIKFARS
ncbi:MAG TPA: mobile mystery protein B [Chitinophagaceae bacterium]|nr:mobile mystery protein B [Chitinophagaceae bacterium]